MRILLQYEFLLRRACTKQDSLGEFCYVFEDHSTNISEGRLAEALHGIPSGFNAHTPTREACLRCAAERFMRFHIDAIMRDEREHGHK